MVIRCSVPAPGALVATTSGSLPAEHGSGAGPVVGVVGAGPAGLTAAISAAGRGRRVVVLEKRSQCGTKLMATGGGRCNLTNRLPPDVFMERFGRHGRFLAPALDALSRDGLIEFMESLGVPTAASDGFHVFPVSQSARQVRDALVRRARALGVELRVGCRAESVVTREGRAVGLQAGGGVIACSGVILAAGGAGYADLGGSTDGYRLAAGAGHAVAEPRPALVPLRTAEIWPRRLTGIVVETAEVALDAPGRARSRTAGAVLFTHSGLSGPAVLDISGDVSEALGRRGTVTLRLRLWPGRSPADWQRDIEAERAGHGTRRILTFLSRWCAASLAGVVLELAGIPLDTTFARLRREQARLLTDRLDEIPVTVAGTAGWAQAMVARGGVDRKEVDPRTMQSRIARGLFVAGELLDVDGPCGGFNLQWAFSSGWLAGTHV